MFSPEASFHGVHGSARNPRRRQRHDSDSAKNQPERKRSKISPTTFQDPSSTTKINRESVALNGHAVNGDEKRRSALRHEIPLREKKPSAPLARKIDGASILTKSPNYTFKQLPSLPERLRLNPREAHRTFALTSSPFAVAITHEYAHVWDYTSPAATTASSHTLQLPFLSKRSDPLPVGSVVNTGPTGDLGLVVIHPTTGEIKFWENVDSAESLSLFQQRRQGIEGSISSMLSGEHVVDLVDAEQAGFILVFSTGRTAQLRVRDSQGRPQISVQFLRTSSQNGSAGFFGGLRSIISGSGWNKDVAAVKVRPSPLKGQLEVVIGTGSGTFQIWDLSWSGNNSLKSEIDAREQILNSLQAISVLEVRSSITTRVLDFSILRSRSKGNEIIDPTAPPSTSILALVAILAPNNVSYALVELDLANNVAIIERTLALDTYSGSSTQAPETAKLLVPTPEHTAFVVFKDAVVINSLARRTETPNMQLTVDQGLPPKPFQDVLYLRQDWKIRFTGFVLEESSRKSKQASCIVFASGVGPIRISAPEPSPDFEKTRVTAKSRIEQAVFFGSSPDSIFDFSAKPELAFDVKEVETAALELSREILDSASEHIPIVIASLAQQIAIRASALDSLARHLKANYPPISRAGKWQLLWNAEKMTAAAGIWEYYEDRLKYEVNQKPLLEELITVLHERYKTELRPEHGEMDPVRQFFIRDASRMMLIVPWASLTIKEIYAEGTRTIEQIMLLVSEADDVFLNSLERAYIFRRDHLQDYGLEGEELDYNILTTGYADLPQPWTANHNLVNCSRQLVDIAREIVFKIYEEHGEIPFAKKVAADNPRLVKLCCQLHMERFRWCLAQSDEKVRASGESLKREFETKVRYQQITALTKIGMADPGMTIAERLRDMVALVDLTWDELTFLKEEHGASATEDEERHFAVSMRKLEQRIRGYFNKFGQAWADALYASHIATRRSALMLDKRGVGQSMLTTFLRSDPNFAKLSWINDVLGESDFASASQALLHVGTSQETRAWGKKVEVSLAKLTLLAADAEGQAEAITKPTEQLARCDAELELGEIQDKIYKHIKGTVDGALDDDSAIDLVMMDYGVLFTKDRPALCQVLKRGFEEIIAHRVVDPGLLIDVLTLMDTTCHEPGRAHDISRNLKFMAFEALAVSAGVMDKQTWEGALKLAWKRVFLSDNWAVINNTATQGDEQTRSTVENSVTWKLLLQGFRNDFWNENPHVQILTPSEVIDAGCRPAELEARFPSEDLRDPIINDNIQDDNELQSVVSSTRADFWFEEIVKLARQTAVNQVEAERRAMLGLDGDDTSDHGDPDVTPRAKPFHPRENGISPVPEESEEDLEEAMDDVQQSIETGSRGGASAAAPAAGGSEGDDEESSATNGDVMEE
ncbi:Non-repetitive/WGA-negative nucleoporin C-terminal-domain-containing protein [Phyllosticta citrichinensis]|uniref:Non-repetitive/WGA-negative nucleoporin C-terminal-domain-containing protein n=1 Tax=Phyllosticta citrichinensis TaxID=1130410 RepID=A0ABR1Y3V8_9PEZI